MTNQSLAWASILASTLLIGGFAQAATVSFGTMANTAIGSCTPACTGIVSDGASGTTTASSSLSYPLGVPPDTAAAMATLSGTSYTPELKALADSTSRDVEAFATGVQTFTNTGAARTITLNLNLEADPLTGDAETKAQVAVFATNQLSDFSRDFGTTAYEIGYDSLVTKTELFLSPTFDNLTAENLALSFFVGEGQAFLIWAGLQARADNGGTADAFNTFTMRFDDDTGLVAASITVSAVPLPAALPLFLTAMGGLGLLGWRKRRVASGAA